MTSFNHKESLGCCWIVYEKVYLSAILGRQLASEGGEPLKPQVGA